MYCVLVDIVQASEIAALQGDVSFTEVVPETRPTWSGVALIEFLRRRAVQVLEEGGEGSRRSLLQRRAMRDKVVVVGKNRPSLQRPTIALGEDKKRFDKPVAQYWRGQHVSLSPGPGRDKIHPCFLQPVWRGMRPILRASHGVGITGQRVLIQHGRTIETKL